MAAVVTFAVTVEKVTDGRDYAEVVTGRLLVGTKAAGEVRGYLIHRQLCPTNRFHSVCDRISRDLHACSEAICDNDGVVQASSVAKNVSRAASTGGFLYIDDMKIDAEHRGQSLGLQLLDAVLRNHQVEWSLCIIQPFVHRKDVPRYGNSPERLARHFIRMGFTQGPRCGGGTDHKLWYYFMEQASMPAPRVLMSKAEVDAIVLEAQPKSHKPQNPVDRELFDLVGVDEYLIGNRSDFRDKVIDLLARGANLDKACVLQVCAGNGLHWQLELFCALGANPSGADSRGTTPLHLAVLSESPEMVETLLQWGANKTARDSDGRAPVDILQVVRSQYDSFSASFGLPPIPPKPRALRVAQLLA